MMESVLILMDMPLFPYRIYAYNELASRGYDLTVMSVNDEDCSYNIPLHFKHIRCKTKKLKSFYKVIGFNAIDLESCDYIIVDPNLRCLSFYKMLFGHKYDRKLLGWGHFRGCTTGNKIASIVRYKFSRKLQALIFYDSQTRDTYVRKGFDPKKLFVANNTQYVNPLTVHLGESKDYFLYVGRIQARKSIDVAIRAFAQFIKYNPESTVTFKIVGGGDSNSLEELCEELKISERVYFEGPQYDEYKLGDIFAHAIAYVSPEQVGLGVLHSFAYGVPVLTCTGRKHGVEFGNCDETNSMLTSYDVNAIAKAMTELYVNPQLQESLSKTAYRHYNEKCTIQRMVDGIDDALKFVKERTANTR